MPGVPEMTGSNDDQIREWVQNGRISKTMADALLEHYAKQSDPTKMEPGDMPASVDLMELMNLIDLLEKKGGVKAVGSLPQDPDPGDVSASGLPRPESGESSYKELQKKYDAVAVELAEEKEAHKEFSEKEFAYAKRFADAEEKRRQAQSEEENKRKSLEEENRRLVEELKQAHEEGARHKRKAGGLEILVEEPRAQVLALEQKCEEYKNEIARLEKACADREAALREAERARSASAGETKLSENEKRSSDPEKPDLATELACKNSDIAALRVKLQKSAAAVEELNARCLELEGSLKGADSRFETARSEKERLEGELRNALKGQEDKQAALLTLESDKNRLEEEVRSLEPLKKIREDERARFEAEKVKLEKALQERVEAVAALQQERAESETAKQTSLAESESRNTLIATLEADKKRFDEEKQSFDVEKTRLEKELQERAEVLAILRQEYEVLDAAKRNALAENESKDALIATLEADKKSFDDEKQGFEAARRGSEADRSRIEAERQQLVAKSKEQADAWELLQKEKDCLSQEVEKMRDAVGNSVARIRELEERAAQVSVQTENMRKRCGELEIEIAQTRAAGEGRASLEEELKRGKEELSKVQAHSKHLEDVLRDLENQIKSIS